MQAIMARSRYSKEVTTLIYTFQFTNDSDIQGIIDANKDKILSEIQHHFDGNFLIFTANDPVSNPISLADYQANKIFQITDLYNQKLAAGFTSSASGASHTYGYAASDQMKFMQVALKVLLSPTTAFPVTVHPKDGSSDSLNQAQYTQLIADIATFAEVLDAQQHSYIVQVNACENIDDVNKITVQF